MELTDAQRRFLALPHVAVLSTLGPDGAPHAAAVWYVPMADRLLVLTGTASQKRKNMERDQRVALIVDRRERPYYALTIRGRATPDATPPSTVREGFAERYLVGDQRNEYLETRRDLPGSVFSITFDRVLEYGRAPD